MSFAVRFLSVTSFLRKYGATIFLTVAAYPVIVAATKGDPDAMKIVLNRYEGDMVALSVRKMRDERGNTYYGVDQDIYDRLRARLIRVVLDFKV